MVLGLGAKVALTGMAGAGAAGVLAPEILFGISYLDGDPQKIRELADTLDDIADKIDKNYREVNASAEKVWKTSKDPAVDEFKEFWTKQYGPAVAAVSIKHRNAANACRAYADTIEKVNHALHVLCWILTVDMMFTIGYQVVTWKILQAIMRRKALALKVSANRFVVMLLPLFAYMLADSAAYATGEVVLPLGLNHLGGVKKDLSGDDVRSAGYNLNAFREHFVANMAFDTVAEGGTALMSKVPGLRNIGTHIKLPNGTELNTGSFLPRMASSVTYSMTMDAQHGDNPLPGAENGLTKEEMYQKFLIHGTRSLVPRPK
ncbi:hypothetical protein Nocox_03875 [Nonomuraea coxensis DSM 45129]|uniref:Outer membrane channel protein CpnT-like N-terminal domain-containing protein n=1 Tax=Nonomuraea coxensis DSM 45129 TaxID=1122611 RepID=A0ABX8TSP2_9ACTN|nr:hypothetical protein [Nonomuraea coxensis]QYC38403.1 hypothetical protein Nocox_03875 [Nonomuraea coxensis DSM 45129]